MKIIESSKIKEKAYIEKLENGMDIIIIPKKNAIKKYIIWGTHFGSIVNHFIMPNTGEEVYIPDGVAHFLEHKMFEQPNGTNSLDTLMALGIDANAYTTNNHTAYLFECTDNFYEGLDELMDYVQHPYFTEENVEKEKGIIGQEIGMYDDDPGWQLYMNAMDCMYKENPIKIDIAGTVESISKITPDVLYKCYNTFYNPANMTMVVCGDFEPEKLLEEIKKRLIKKENQGEIKRIYAKEERGINQKEKEAILSIPLDYSFMKNEEKLSVVERFQQHAGVKDVLLADIAYTQGVSGNLLMTEKGNDNSWTDINIMCVPLNFFAFMNIPIEEGRTIRTKNDLVMDKVWQNKQKKNVIGMNFYDQNNDYTVCGVCTPFQTDVHYHSGGYAFMLYDPSEYVGHCYVKCYPEQQKEVVKWIEKIRREVLPENISYQVRTFQDDLYEIQAMEYMLKDTILFFAIVSIIITLLGVYSSITLDTERRQKEVAIRKVNGAGMSHIIWLFARLYITLLMVTAALSFPLVYLVLQLWKQIYTVFFNCGFWFWTGIFISVAMITALTIWFRILKIARVNPVESIKNE